MELDKILSLGLNPGDPDMPLAYRLLYQLIEEKYTPLLDASSDFMCIVDRDGKFVYVNKNLARTLGYTKKELFGMLLVDVVARESLRDFAEKTKEFLKSGKMCIPHLVLTTRDGQNIVGEMSSSAFYDNTGRFCGAKAVFKDHTKFLEIETLEKKYESMLGDGIGAFHHAIMEHAVEGIVEMKADNTIVFANRSFLNKLGLTEAEALGLPLTDFILAEQRDFLVSVKLIRRAREIIFVRKDGSLMYTLTSGIPFLFGAQGPHALCFISDITDTKLGTLKLRDANITLRALNDSLVDLSLSDPRTGAYNARYLSERLPQEMERAKRSTRSFSLLVIDIDFFKALNDAHGHSFGDLILKGFAGLLKTSVRAADVVVRSGGDEFVILLPDTDVDGGLAVARKIVQAVKTVFLGSPAKKIHISTSIGVAGYPDIGPGADAAGLLNAADRAMYQSKSRGRNRITVNRKIIQGLRKEVAVLSGADLLKSVRQRLVQVNLRSEESMLESLKSMIDELYFYMGYPDVAVDKYLKNVEALAMSLSWIPQEIHRLKRAALLANLGSLEVPQDILLKAGNLSPDEINMVRRHPLRSVDLIRDIPFLEPLVNDILCHHEHFDGSGYPRGLSSENIPLGARIIGLAESYEALLRSRPYRIKPFSEEESLDIIRQESGKQFDPVVVEHFLKLAA